MLDIFHVRNQSAILFFLIQYSIPWLDHDLFHQPPTDQHSGCFCACITNTTAKNILSQKSLLHVSKYIHRVNSQQWQTSVKSDLFFYYVFYILPNGPTSRLYHLPYCPTTYEKNYTFTSRILFVTVLLVGWGTSQVSNSNAKSRKIKNPSFPSSPVLVTYSHTTPGSLCHPQEPSTVPSFSARNEWEPWRNPREWLLSEDSQENAKLNTSLFHRLLTSCIQPEEYYLPTV